MQLRDSADACVFSLALCALCALLIWSFSTHALMLAHARLRFGAFVCVCDLALVTLHFAASALTISCRRLLKSYFYDNICASARKAAAYYAFTWRVAPCAYAHALTLTVLLLRFTLMFLDFVCAFYARKIVLALLRYFVITRTFVQRVSFFCDRL